MPGSDSDNPVRIGPFKRLKNVNWPTGLVLVIEAFYNIQVSAGGEGGFPPAPTIPDISPTISIQGINLVRSIINQVPEDIPIAEYKLNSIMTLDNHEFEETQSSGTGASPGTGWYATLDITLGQIILPSSYYTMVQDNFPYASSGALESAIEAWREFAPGWSHASFFLGFVNADDFSRRKTETRRMIHIIKVSELTFDAQTNTAEFTITNSGLPDTENPSYSGGLTYIVQLCRADLGGPFADFIVLDEKVYGRPAGGGGGEEGEEEEEEFELDDNTTIVTVDRDSDTLEMDPSDGGPID